MKHFHYRTDISKRLNSRNKTGQELLLFTLLFAVSSLAAFGILLKNGKTLIWQTDGLGQYYPAFLYIGQYIRDFFAGIFSGKLSLPLFDLSIGMGEGVIGTLNYYGFGDPVNLLAVFATKNNGHLVYGILFFLRLYLAGLGFCFYSRKMKIRGFCGILGAVSYIFSGFVLWGGACYIEWLSVLIYFPLMLIGCEDILRGKRGTWLLLAVAFGGLSGFYFLYMASLGLALYALIRTLFCRKGRQLREHGRFILKCLIWYFSGILISAPILFPTIQALFFSQRSSLSVLEVLTDKANYIFSVPGDWWRLFFDPSYVEKDSMMSLMLILTLSSLLLAVLPKGIIAWSGRRRQLLLALLILIAAWFLPLTGYLFNAFGETNNRWVFLFYFVLSLNFAFLLSGLTDFLEKREKKKKASGKAGGKTVYLMLGAAAVLLILNIGFEGIKLYSSRGINWKEEFVSAENLNETYIDSPAAKSAKVMSDTETFRVETTLLTGINGRPENVAMLNGYQGMTYWFSIVNKRTQSYVNLVSDVAYHWRSYGLNGWPAAETISGVKYLITDDTSNVPAEYLWTEETEFNGSAWQVYENPYFTGMASVRSEKADRKLWKNYLGDLTEEDLMDLATQNAGGTSLASAKDPIDGSAFRAYLKAVWQNSRENAYGDILSFENDGNVISLEAQVLEGDEVVISVPYSRNWKAYVDGRETAVTTRDLMNMSVEGLSAGSHTIILKYSSGPFYGGTAAALAVLLLLLLLTGRQRKKRSKR